MKKKTSRLLACLLVCLLAVSPMAACNDDGTETESDSVSESVSESTPDIVEVPDVAIAGVDIADFSVTDAEGKRDLTTLENYYKLFTNALKLETLTDDQRAHVEYASMHLLHYYKDFFAGKERRELEAVWDDLVAKYGLPGGVLM